MFRKRLGGRPTPSRWLHRMCRDLFGHGPIPLRRRTRMPERRAAPRHVRHRRHRRHRAGSPAPIGRIRHALCAMRPAPGVFQHRPTLALAHFGHACHPFRVTTGNSVAAPCAQALVLPATQGGDDDRRSRTQKRRTPPERGSSWWHRDAAGSVTRPAASACAPSAPGRRWYARRSGAPRDAPGRFPRRYRRSSRSRRLPDA